MHRLVEIRARAQKIAKMNVDQLTNLSLPEIAQMNVDNKRLLIMVDKLMAELDKYKAHSEMISALHDCNDCAHHMSCEVAPRWGATVRINCHLWRGKE